jgi:hypothetical protein
LTKGACGGNSTTLATGLNPSAPALSGGEAFMMNKDLSTYQFGAVVGDTLLKVPVGGGASVMLWSGTDYSDDDLAPPPPVADQESVYWIAGPASETTILKVGQSGGTATAIAAGGIVSIAVDASSVYWTDLQGRVMKRPK